MKTSKNWKWHDELFLYIFGMMGVFGWFLVIWSPIYKWQLFFTCLLSFVLSMVYVSIKKDKEKGGKK